MSSAIEACKKAVEAWWGALPVAERKTKYRMSELVKILGANNNAGSGFNPVFNTGGPRNFQFALKLFF